MASRTAAMRMVVLLLFLESGCAATQSIGNTIQESSKPFKPRGADYRDTTSEAQEDWDQYGKTARGDRALDKENDPLRDWLMSPKARAIEQSLGYD